VNGRTCTRIETDKTQQSKIQLSVQSSVITQQLNLKRHVPRAFPAHTVQAQMLSRTQHSQAERLRQKLPFSLFFSTHVLPQCRIKYSSHANTIQWLRDHGSTYVCILASLLTLPFAVAFCQ